MKSSSKTILITAGPTREHIDPVRFITNLSTGTLGYQLARAAQRRGHRVILVSGPTHLSVPHGVRYIPIVSAEELNEVVHRLFPRVDVLFMTSAVCDFTPAVCMHQKVKQKKGMLKLSLKPTPDIISSVARRKKPGQRVCGFCLETHAREKFAREKLERKGMDCIVASRYAHNENPFGEREMNPQIITREGIVKHFHRISKPRLATYLIQAIAEGTLWQRKQ